MWRGRGDAGGLGSHAGGRSGAGQVAAPARAPPVEQPVRPPHQREGQEVGAEAAGAIGDGRRVEADPPSRRGTPWSIGLSTGSLVKTQR